MFAEAERVLAAGELVKASEMFATLTEHEVSAPFAYYRLASIVNITGDPVTSKKLYYKAFDAKPDILGEVLPQGHANRGYVFPGMQYEPAQDRCPLCGGEGKPRWCYVLFEAVSGEALSGEGADYNPVRLWMHCEACNHMYAEEFPVQEFKPANDKDKLSGRQPNTGFFAIYADILSRIKNHTSGNELLEIGIGGNECILTAREMGYNVFGLDIAEGNVEVAKKYGINAEANDFMKFTPNQKWDVVIMGDVIEHISDPVAGLEKVCSMLNPGGCLWVSTPNFESAFSSVTGHLDAMRRIDSHKNYFSRDSLYMLLQKYNLKPVDYRISRHYNGCMEVVAVKEA